MTYDPVKLLNPNVAELAPSGIRKLFDIASKMEDVVSLGIGEPDFITPWHIRNAALLALEHGRTQYTANAGLAQLKEEISLYMSRRFNMDYSPDGQIFVTVGGSEAIDLTIRTLISPGDEVIIPQPSFVCYGPLVKMAGGVPVYLDTREEDDFKLTPKLLSGAITPKTKLLIMPFPNNPTGAIMTREELAPIAHILSDTDITVLSDEIYAELTYSDIRHVSISSLPGMYDRTVVASGFSKAFAMTGWRLGFVCGHPAIISQMLKLHQYAIMCAPTVSQYAAVEALRRGDPDIEAMKAEYDSRRRLITDAFNNMGLHCFEPKGAFYCFPSIRSTGLSSDEFCERLLNEKHVALVPGAAFGRCGDGNVRVSYAYSVDHIKTALERIEEFIKEL